MAYIELGRPLPGMAGLLSSYPVTGSALGQLAEAVLTRDDGLSRAERELIGAFVSAGNGCTYCRSVHGAVACAHLESGGPVGLGSVVVAQVVDRGMGADPASLDDVEGLAPRLRHLLELADQVRRGGNQVRPATVQAARAAGATDPEIHDAVLVAAMFCLFNRYVDGLGTALPDDTDWYDATAHRLARNGYAPSPGRAFPPALDQEHRTPHKAP